jgi:hypothetical protein
MEWAEAAEAPHLVVGVLFLLCIVYVATLGRWGEVERRIQGNARQ